MTDGEKLLSWYDLHSRDLPWRENTDPYPVWVSEVMLQQTRVETVIPYFYRFLEEFPSVEELAAAPVDRVLVLWSGLGYYRRARQMHAAARVVAEMGGEFPSSAKQLQALPGIGPYTSAAIASISFGEMVPVVDGNVERVVSRRLALKEFPRSKAGRAAISKAAKELLVLDRPGDGNQAIMELGATVCIPRAPLCSGCPIFEGCLAKERDEVGSYPRQPAKKPVKRMRRRVAVVVDGERILLFRRPDESILLAGTWELPWVESSVKKDEDLSASENELTNTYGGLWRLTQQQGEVRHSITFRALVLEIHFAELSSSGELAENVEAGWFLPKELSGLPLSSQVFKALKKVGLCPSGGAAA
ncbi:MAG: A/G-specific adenine glycosylase [Deltaproteobacteria bacterium]|nr:A/G-specific adenine glycosylase [Deltaproteobacteria bacterium]